MPNTVIEAQTNGVTCFLSDTITNEVRVTDAVTMISLSKDAIYWANRVILAVNNNIDFRNTRADIMRNNGYDIKDCTRRFIELVYE